jgi:DNA-binding transcriptional LysR family regulator
VRIAASAAVCAHLLPPVLTALRAEHPGISIELVVSNASSDLRKREADIAVRHYRPEGDDLIARLVLDRSEAHLYAAPGYLASIGSPRTAQALAARGEVFAFDEDTRLLLELQSAGYPFGRENLAVTTGDQLVQWELTRRGLGMCVMMSEIGDRDTSVRRALDGGAPVATLSTWLTTHRELRTNRRMRVVFDALAARLSSL